MKRYVHAKKGSKGVQRGKNFETTNKKREGKRGTLFSGRDLGSGKSRR